MFQLTEKEDAPLRRHFGTASKRNTRYRPYAFTKDGIVMLANVLKSPVAIPASIQIVRAFNRMRRMVAAHKDVAAALAELENKVASHDVQIQALFAAIRRFLEPPAEAAPQDRLQARLGRSVLGQDVRGEDLDMRQRGAL
ncbi:MAG: hypothetical protein HY926_14205 [Elusimicrobia bacterium]|nr:hypothetical protein [Elusimicrobiota bacterium]